MDYLSMSDTELEYRLEEAEKEVFKIQSEDFWSFEARQNLTRLNLLQAVLRAEVERRKNDTLASVG